jgi:hypothetical protein
MKKFKYIIPLIESAVLICFFIFPVAGQIFAQECKQIEIQYQQSGCAAPSIPKPQEGNRPLTVDACVGQPFIYSASGTVGVEGSYLWTATGPAVVYFIPNNTSLSVTIVWPQPGIYTLILTVDDGTGNIYTSSINVNVSDKPHADFTFSPGNNICIGSTVFFDNQSTFDGPMTFLWDFGDNSPLTDVTDPSHTYTQAGTYEVTLIASSFVLNTDIICNNPGKPCDTIRSIKSCCADTIRRTITIQDGNISIGCISTVCAGDTSAYTVSGCTNVTWLLPVGGTILNSDNSHITIVWGDGTTQGIIQAQCNGGCVASVNVPIIPDHPQLISSSLHCSNSISNFTLPLFPGTFYHWHLTNSSNQNLDNLLNTYPDNNAVWINWGNLTGTFTLTVDLINKHLCCEKTGAITFNVKSPFKAFSNQTICPGNYPNLYVYPNTGSFTWDIKNTDGTIVCSNCTTNPFPNLSTGNYIATATNTSGNFCNSTSQVFITVLDSPVPGVINGTAFVCPNGSYNYSMSTNAPEGYYYYWSIASGSGTFQPGNQTHASGNNVNIKWTTLQATISVTLKRSSLPMCESGPITLLVKKGDIGTINGNTSVCADNQSSYSLQNSNLPTGETINWSITPANLGTIVSVQGLNNIQVYWHGNVPSATLTATSNCGSTNIPISIHLPTTGSITQNGTDLCNNVTLQAGSGSNHLWYHNGVLQSGGSSGNLPITSGGNYSVSYTDTYGCNVTGTISVPDIDCQVLITTPGPTAYCPDQPVNTLLIASSTGQSCAGFTYHWYRNNVQIPGQNSLSFNATSIGSYYVQAVKGNCTVTSNIVNIYFANCPEGCICTNPQTGTFSISQNPVCNPAVFNTTYNNVTWYFGDGYSSGTENTTHFYQLPGYYIVQINVPCENNCFQLFRDTVFIPIAPDFSIETVCLNTAFHDLSQTYQNVGNISSWNWNFGDGATSTAENPSHAFSGPGSYNVTLTITYVNSSLNIQCTSSVTKTVIITAPSNPGITIIQPVCTNVPTPFSTNTANMLSYVWNFGDSSFGYQEHATHSYSDTGTYTVTLTVTDLNGCTASSTSTVNVKQGISNCHIEPGFICTGGSTTLHAPSGNYSYQWQQVMGGSVTDIGSNSNTLNVGNPGFYQVVLTNSVNQCTCTSNTVQVSEIKAQKAIINASPLHLCGPGLVNFSTPNIQGCTYQWFFGNSGSPVTNFFTNQNITTNTQVTLIVTNEYGCKDTCSMIYSVFQKPAAPIISSNNGNCEGVPITLSVLNYQNNITWNNGVSVPTLLVTSAGTYTAVYTDPNTGCTNESSFTVFRKPPLDLFPHDCDTIPCTCRNEDDSFTIYAPEPLVGAFNENYSIKWYKIPATLVQTGGSSLTLPSGTTGTYYIVVTNTTTQCSERSNDYSIVIPECDSCNCTNSHFINLSWNSIDNPVEAVKFNCGQRMGEINCNHPVAFNAGFLCDPPSCNQVVTYSLFNNGSISQSGNMPFTTSGLTAGFYTLEMYGRCNDIICDTCVITFQIVCDQTPCCPQMNQISIRNSNENLSQQSYQGHDYSLYTTQVSIVGGNTPYTEVRATVVDFELTANYSNCIDCANLPFTWASLSATTLAGITPVTTLPSSVTGYVVPSNIYGNPREVVWENNGGLIDLSIPQSTNLSFYLPSESSIPCCGLKAKICVKYSLYDINCNLCEIVKCYEVAIGDTTLSESCCCEKWSGRPVYLTLKSNVQNDSERADQKINPLPTPIPIGWSVRCGEVIYLSVGVYSISGPEFHCSPASCNVTYSWLVGGTQGGQVYGSGTGSTFIHNFSSPGKYTITITPKCGSCNCAPCTFEVQIGKKVSPSAPLPSNSVNNYGINDEGIKRTTSQDLTPANNYGINDEGVKKEVSNAQDGEPVPGMEVYVEQEPTKEPIANVVTDENGEIEIVVSRNSELPASGIFSFTIIPSKAFKSKSNLPDSYKEKIMVPYTRNITGKYRFVLKWITKPEMQKSNKGIFAVSGRNST